MTLLGRVAALITIHPSIMVCGLCCGSHLSQQVHAT